MLYLHDDRAVTVGNNLRPKGSYGWEVHPHTRLKGKERGYQRCEVRATGQGRDTHGYGGHCCHDRSARLNFHVARLQSAYNLIQSTRNENNHNPKTILIVSTDSLNHLQV